MSNSNQAATVGNDKKEVEILESNQSQIQECSTSDQSLNQNASDEDMQVMCVSTQGSQQSQQEKYMTFLHLYLHGQVVMNNTFLPFLSLNEIFKLSMTCNSIRRVIDPASFKFRRRKNKRFAQKASTFHLKRIAANQLINIALDQLLDHQSIDAIFGVNVRRLSDFAYLDGQIYKDQIQAILEELPNFNGYTRQKVDSSYHENIWQKQGNSMQQLKHLGNPLERIIRTSKVSFSSGGIFRLRHIRYGNHRDRYFLDYDIMIEKIERQEDYQKLRDLEAIARLAEEGQCQSYMIKFEEIKHVINGVGRLYQYQYINTSIITEANSKRLHGIFDGQFKNGNIEGFGVLMMPQRLVHYVGYYKKGFLYGKYIMLNDSASAVTSIYDVVRLGYGDYENEREEGRYCDMDLTHNITEPEMHEIRKKKLQSGKFMSSTYPEWLKREFPDIYDRDNV